MMAAENFCSRGELPMVLDATTRSDKPSTLSARTLHQLPHELLAERELKHMPRPQPPRHYLQAPNDADDVALERGGWMGEAQSTSSLHTTSNADDSLQMSMNLAPLDHWYTTLIMPGLNLAT